MTINDCVIDALKIGYKAEAILKRSSSGLSVHSIFKHAVNLIDDSDWIITIQPKDYPAGPQSIIVAKEGFAVLKSLVLRASGNYYFQKIINTSSAQITCKKTIKGTAPKDIIKIESNRAFFKDLLYQKGSKSGLLGEESIYSRYAAPVLKESQNLFCSQRYEEAGEKLMGIIGLGPGLTPSGDDFVLGILAVLYSSGINADIILILRGIIIQKAKNKTNIISYNMLRQGAMGGFLEWVEDMAQSVIYKGPQEIEEAFARMKRIGSSSGSDICAGILYGLDVIRR